MALEHIPPLGCGRSFDRICATSERPPTAHEEQCEHCQAVRSRLQRLGEATRSMRQSDLSDPTLEPRPGIKNAIMDAARAEIRHGSRILLRTSANGSTEISERALSSLIRFAAAAIPGVHSRRCRIELGSAEPGPAGKDSAGTIGKSSDSGTATTVSLIVNLRVAAAPGIVIPRTMEALRHEISNALPAAVGIGAGTVNITVEDLYDV